MAFRIVSITAQAADIECYQQLNTRLHEEISFKEPRQFQLIVLIFADWKCYWLYWSIFVDFCLDCLSKSFELDATVQQW